MLDDGLNGPEGDMEGDWLSLFPEGVVESQPLEGGGLARV